MEPGSGGGGGGGGGGGAANDSAGHPHLNHGAPSMTCTYVDFVVLGAVFILYALWWSVQTARVFFYVRWKHAEFRSALVYPCSKRRWKQLAQTAVEICILVCALLVVTNYRQVPQTQWTDGSSSSSSGGSGGGSRGSSSSGSSSRAVISGAGGSGVGGGVLRNVSGGVGVGGVVGVGVGVQQSDKDGMFQLRSCIVLVALVLSCLVGAALQQQQHQQQQQQHRHQGSTCIPGLVMPRGLDYIMLAFAFGVEAILFGHYVMDDDGGGGGAWGRRGAVGGSETFASVGENLVTYCAVVTSVLSVLELHYRHQVAFPFARSFVTLVQGTWLCQYGAVACSSSPYKWDPTEYNVGVLSTCFAGHAMMGLTVTFAVWCAVQRMTIASAGGAAAAAAVASAASERSRCCCCCLLCGCDGRRCPPAFLLLPPPVVGHLDRSNDVFLENRVHFDYRVLDRIGDSDNNE
ncbi:hypothetical protein Ahia01_001104500 [Argonauta hians]